MAQKYVAQRTLAEWLGVTPRSVANFTNMGMPCARTAKGVRYPWPECRRWRDEQLQKSARDAVESAKPGNFEAAKARKMAADAAKSELELEQLRGKLIELDAHEARVARLCDRLAAVCKGGLSKYMADVQRAATAADALALLEKIGDAMLRALGGQADGIEDEIELATEEVA